LDLELVRRGLAPTREQALAAIEAGRVRVGGAPAAKPSRLVAPNEAVVVTGPAPRFVGRGGAKLDAALDRFSIDPNGRRCLDAGASTGGFTDCLLQRGAASVLAVDVGRAQLHERLRGDTRVTAMERTDIRAVAVADAGGTPFDLIVADLSFISLRLVAPALLGPLAAEGGDVVVLIKPQFEAGRAQVSRGRGVVRDPAVWRSVLDGVSSVLHRQGAAMMGLMVSPLTGADGNVEFLAHLRAHSSATGEGPRVDVAGVITEALGHHGRAGRGPLGSADQAGGSMLPGAASRPSSEVSAPATPVVPGPAS
jgi:23S rRNA (cytidine1920-2'-O)/16S rRNA (cytidine1409-2'-O)-methyltransferase